MTITPTTPRPVTKPQVTLDGYELHPTIASYLSYKTWEMEWRTDPYNSVLIAPDGERTADLSVNIYTRKTPQGHKRVYYGHFPGVTGQDCERRIEARIYGLRVKDENGYAAFNSLAKLREAAVRCYIANETRKTA